ncbi:MULTISPECIES: response regulator transcription factor [unclassified Oleiphilus]|uniref:response regulator n=1 Tax=unclassified Oleiphilus TaxID=2631174 RepID=UPI0007C36AEB|nr:MULTISPECIES: response regulator transcription factor [unclassified Oleiphilus]KZY43604.1 hypothetical protein A3732_01980 [Oleiphilus sp. HI0050]KZZ37560.1 hypothetical protein A3757_10770 [Oleiphilus sp. HI0117]KZZ39453.1 hypothetical protein A3756_08470 [Oleiphilus sp. HI0086]
MSAVYKIIIIDDHHLFVSALKELFELLLPDAEVFIFTEAFQALSFINSQEQKVDLVLLDISLKDENGFNTLLRIKEKHLSLPVAFLTASEDNKDVAKCFKLGGKGFIPKSLSPEATVQAIKLILAGEEYIPGFYLRPTSQTARSNNFSLTARQNEVLSYLKKGASNKQIAENLGISEGTVKIHVSAILKLFNLNSRAEVIASL